MSRMPVAPAHRQRITDHWSLVTSLVACALAATLATPVCAAPTIERSTGRVTVTTRRYVATFDQAAGSLLTSLSTREGDALITGSRIYQDNMMGYPRKYYGPTSDTPPAARVEDDGKRVIVEAKGRLLDADGKPHEVGDFAYVVRYTFDDSPKIGIATTLTVGFDEPELRGFLAHIFTTAPQREFFANTADGRISELAATRTQRTWQSRQEPLSESAPWLGCVLRNGYVLRFTVGRLTEPLQNIFFHDSGRGPTTVFFAWLDGGVARPVRRGATWALDVEIEADKLGDFKEFR